MKNKKEIKEMLALMEDPDCKGYNSCSKCPATKVCDTAVRAFKWVLEIE